jgi:hypothetical protein
VEPPPIFRAPVGARVIINTKKPSTTLEVRVRGRAVRTKRLSDVRWQIRTPRRSGWVELATTYEDGSWSEASSRLKALRRQ